VFVNSTVTMASLSTGFHCRSYASRQAVVTVVSILILHHAESTPTESAATQWCPGVCDCYNNMETVDCSQRRLHIVPEGLPESARRVYLEDNNIGQIDPEEFKRSRRLSQLVLDRNRLTSVDTATFCVMTSLQELSLSANMIGSFLISRRPGCVSAALRQLDLSLNLLTTVPVNLSTFAPRLEIVDLSCNEITAATLDGSFRRLTSLRQLDLSRNRIHVLFTADLQPLRDVPLDVLNLAETELAVIEDEALCPVSDSLKYLSLMGNPLDPDNLARALSRYAPRDVDAGSGNFTDHNTSKQSASQSSKAALSVVPLPLTRLSIGEMTVGNISRDMLAQFHHAPRVSTQRLLDDGKQKKARKMTMMMKRTCSVSFTICWCWTRHLVTSSGWNRNCLTTSPAWRHCTWRLVGWQPWRTCRQ